LVRELQNSLHGKVARQKEDFRKMNKFTSRATIIGAIVASVLLPLYAHHGTQFLSKAMEMNLAEVRMGELAVKKTQNAQVKDFAEMMIRDHNQALDKLRELRDARLAGSVSNSQASRSTGQMAVADTRLSPEDQRTFDRLSALSGSNFDRSYMDVMVREHRQAIRDYEAQTRAHGNSTTQRQPANGSTSQTARQKPSAPDQQQKYSTDELNRDVDTAEFAAASLPTLRHHLQEAERIQKQLPAK
jgi:predicted outer membrane protein